MYPANTPDISIRYGVQYDRGALSAQLYTVYIRGMKYKIPMKGESDGYTVKSMEKDFPISNYPLEQTEFLYDSKQGTVDCLIIAFPIAF